jgi:hypothetical protein
MRGSSKLSNFDQTAICLIGIILLTFWRFITNRLGINHAEPGVQMRIERLRRKEGTDMKQRLLFLWIFGIVLTTIGLQSCAAVSPDASTPSASTPAGWTTSDLVFQYRQQAVELRETARRLEFEAGLYAQRQEQEQAHRSRDLAKDLWAAADTAEEQAREYRRQLPHNQVY